MNKLFPLLALAAISCSIQERASSPPLARAAFATLFTGKTLRFDYNHTGIAGDEYVSLAQVRLEGDWPGSRKVLVDHTGLGKYIFLVRDLGPATLKTFALGIVPVFPSPSSRRIPWSCTHLCKLL